MTGIRIRTPSRLHFGLLSLPADSAWSATTRRYGGVGLMIETPELRMSATPAREWYAPESHGSLLFHYARQFANAVAVRWPERRQRPQAFLIEQDVPQHAGFGSGTQLALAVARVLATDWGLPEMEVQELATAVGRGGRSGLGVHGFQVGGFLVEGGKGPGSTSSPLLAHMPLPEPWRVVIVLPRGACGVHGLKERQAFEVICQGAAPQATERMCRLVLLGILPAIAERNLKAFGQAVHEYNRLAGEMFARVQGGVYAHARTAELVDALGQLGVHGAGQSSWGPTVFGFAADEDEAASAAERIRVGVKMDLDAWWTRAAQRGWQIEEF